MKKLSLITMIMMGMFFIACGDGDDPDPEPEPQVCETTGMTYTSNIKALIDASCATAGCHVPGTATFPMDSWDGVVAAVSFGRISGAINHTMGFSPMPKGGSKLDQCSIDQIDAWLDDGAPQ